MVISGWYEILYIPKDLLLMCRSRIPSIKSSQRHFKRGEGEDFLKAFLHIKGFSLEGCCTAAYREVAAASHPLLWLIIKTNGLSAYIKVIYT